jgi:predicted GNAT family acetyltransferase
MPDLQVVNHESAHRFEATSEGSVAFLSYRLHPGEMVLIHTEVPLALEGRGLGGKLARTALHFARAHQLRVVAQCPFVAEYIKRHTEYADLVRNP